MPQFFAQGLDATRTQNNFLDKIIMYQNGHRNTHIILGHTEHTHKTMNHLHIRYGGHLRHGGNLEKKKNLKIENNK